LMHIILGCGKATPKGASAIPAHRRELWEEASIIRRWVWNAILSSMVLELLELVKLCAVIYRW
jgi:hypothetical protein